MEEKQPGGSGATAGDSRPDDQTQEKSTVGGEYNSGVTSRDAGEKKDIEKQATMLGSQPQNGKHDRPADSHTDGSTPTA